MFTEGIFPIGDGLLDIDEERLKGLLVAHDINEIYEVEQTPFARGKFAAVRRAVHKNSGVHFAAKFLKRRRRAQSSDKEIKHEIAVLMLCDEAENIVKLNAVHESRSDTALLLELATGGELQTFLDNEECLSEAQARICMREVLKALQFLHKLSIVHLDLKPQNILLTGERIEDGLKLCDFGISRVVAEGTNVREIVGTPDYVAPEVLQYEPLSLLTDIWSVGVLAYVLLSGFSPFGGETKQETFLNISQCALTFPDKLFGGVSGAAIDFIRRALRIKPSDRMTAAGCLEHTWLKDECPINRPIFNKLAQKDVEEENAEDADIDEDRDISIDDDEEEEEEDDDEEEEEDDDDEEDEISTDDTNAMNGRSSRILTTDLAQECPQRMSNGKAPLATATAILSVPAARATTIPLCNNQTHAVAARRHSSDSNKENTFLSTKKISPASLANGGKKSAPSSPTVIANTTTTATIMIQPNNGTATSPNVVATITLPNGAHCTDKSNNTAASQCFFPDAPTTPKVIRKAPTAETSPTSVKALVKKFQLESANGEKQALLAKENAPQEQPLPPTKALNGHKSADKCANGYHHNHNNHHNNNNNNSSNNNKSNSLRRASEPLTAVHKKAPISPTMRSGNGSVGNYKSTCVLCLTCSNGGGVGTTTTVTTTGGGAATTTTTTTGCRHSAVSTSPTRTNGSTSSSSSRGDATATTTTTPRPPTANGSGKSPTASSAATAAFLLQHHPHHHHHHHHGHHHHHVGKNVAAAQNLSLDQGIIC